MSGAVFYISLFLAWGRMIEPSTGAAIAIMSGVIFFIAGTVKIINKKEIPEEEKKSSVVQKGFQLLIFILPFYILSFYFIPKFHHWNGTYLELYKYHDYPCEYKTFTTKEKMALLTHHDGMLPQSAYYLTHNSLTAYKKELERDYYNQISYIPKDTKFRVIGFYLPIARGSGLGQYYLVETLDDNKTKAWIGQFNFNTEKCYPEKIPYYKEASFSARRGAYGEERIDLSNLTILP